MGGYIALCRCFYFSTFFLIFLYYYIDIYVDVCLVVFFRPIHICEIYYFYINPLWMHLIGFEIFFEYFGYLETYFNDWMRLKDYGEIFEYVVY